MSGLTEENVVEIERLASLLATARCRKLAVALGHPGSGETYDNTKERASQAFSNLDKYLTELVTVTNKKENENG
jgi:hypothetical protein